jgi:thermostable 8-oxoguanine DNA glycosylase
MKSDQNLIALTIYEQINLFLQDRVGSIITASEIKDALKTKYGTNKSSIIPSDYCYNRFNDGIKFDKHIFEYIGHNTYKYLGENYPFTGLIIHKPNDTENKLIYGEWNNGRKIIYKTPVVKDSVEAIKIMESFARTDVPISVNETEESIESTTHDNSNILPQLRSRHQIETLINRADDYVETKRLIGKIDGLKNIRDPFYLDINDLDEILHWKLRSQYSRQKRNIQLNTDALVINVTKHAFSISDVNERNVVELMMKALVNLHGVQIPVASAIMTLCYPEKYCVIDFRGWRQVYSKEKEHGNYSIREYIEYWTIIKSTANKYGVTPQEVDLAIWQFDIENHRKE